MPTRIVEGFPAYRAQRENYLTGARLRGGMGGFGTITASAVKALQSALKAHWNSAIIVDGVLGPKTYAAAKAAAQYLWDNWVHLDHPLTSDEKDTIARAIAGWASEGQSYTMYIANNCIPLANIFGRYDGTGKYTNSGGGGSTGGGGGGTTQVECSSGYLKDSAGRCVKIPISSGEGEKEPPPETPWYKKPWVMGLFAAAAIGAVVVAGTGPSEDEKKKKEQQKAVGGCGCGR